MPRLVPNGVFFTGAKRKEILKQVRASKQNRPKASDAYHLAQSLFLTENRLNKLFDASGSYESANDRLLRVNARSRS